MTMQGISVIIPVYNREAYLEEAIRSVLMQDYSGLLEIIVSDDGSSDKSVEIANSFGHPVRVVLKPEVCLSQGVSGARNRGIAEAKYSYIAFLDSDDLFLPNHLNRIAEKLEKNHDLGFVFCRMLQMKDDGENRLFAPWTKKIIDKKNIKYPVVSGSNVIHTNIILIRKSVFSLVGFFDESFSNGEDGDLWMRISEKYKGEFLSYYGAVYRISHQGGQLSDKKNQEIINKNFEKVFRSAYQRCRKNNKRDSYRFYRIQLILIGYAKNKWFKLILLLVRYPYFVIKDYFNIQKIIDGRRRIIWEKTIEL